MLVENNCGGWERAGSGLVISYGGAFRGLSEFYSKDWLCCHGRDSFLLAGFASPDLQMKVPTYS